jgi:hypothetical protein
MTTVVTTHPCKAMGEIPAGEEFFNNLGNDRPKEPIVSLITLIIHPYKFLKMISDTVIEGALIRIPGMVYAR